MKKRKSSLKQFAVYFKNGFTLIMARNKRFAESKFNKQQNYLIPILKVERAEINEQRHYKLTIGT